MVTLLASLVCAAEILRLTSASSVPNDQMTELSSCLLYGNPSNQRNLSYSDGSQHPVSIPYPSWSSIQLSAHIAQIILSEIMNYSTVFYVQDTIDDSIILADAVGCLNPEDHVCQNRDTEHPKIHFTLETWDTGYEWQSTTLPVAVQATLISTLDYSGIDGYFLWTDVVESALRSPSRAVLDHYHAYNASLNSPAAFFDPWQRILELIPPQLVYPCSTTGPPEDPYYSTLYADLTNDTAGCALDSRVWFSPACRANTSACVPTLIQYSMPAAAQLAFFLNMPLAVVYVLAGDSNYQEYYAAVRAGRFLFGYYAPNDALVDARGRLPEQAPARAPAEISPRSGDRNERTACQTRLPAGLGYGI